MNRQHLILQLRSVSNHALSLVSTLDRERESGGTRAPNHPDDTARIPADLQALRDAMVVVEAEFSAAGADANEAA